MRAVGPLWAFALTVDRDLMLAVLTVNLAFTLALLLLAFRRRRPLDRLLIGVGLFCLISAAGLAGLYAFARTPVRDVQFFALD